MFSCKLLPLYKELDSQLECTPVARRDLRRFVLSKRTVLLHRGGTPHLLGGSLHSSCHSATLSPLDHLRPSHKPASPTPDIYTRDTEDVGSHGQLGLGAMTDPASQCATCRAHHPITRSPPLHAELSRCFTSLVTAIRTLASRLVCCSVPHRGSPKLSCMIRKLPSAAWDGLIPIGTSKHGPIELDPQDMSCGALPCGLIRTRVGQFMNERIRPYLAVSARSIDYCPKELQLS